MTTPERTNIFTLQNGWVVALGEMMPSLWRIYIAHSYSEQLEYEGSAWYSGERNVRYREAPDEDWASGCWLFSSPSLDTPLRHMQRKSLRNPRTTEKAHFDPWESDGEYAENPEYGWSTSKMGDLVEM